MLPKIRVALRATREQDALNEPRELPQMSTSRSHYRSIAARGAQNTEPNYMYTNDENVGDGDGYSTKEAVTLEDLTTGLQSLPHKFDEFHNKSKAQSEEWIDSSSQDPDYVP